MLFSFQLGAENHRINMSVLSIRIVKNATHSIIINHASRVNLAGSTGIMATAMREVCKASFNMK